MGMELNIPAHICFSCGSFNFMTVDKFVKTRQENQSANATQPTTS